MENYTPKEKSHPPKVNNKIPAYLHFMLLPLYPSDCLSLVYYARLKSKKEYLIDITLCLCSITDVGLEAFSNEMSKGIIEVTPGDTHLNIMGNPIITDRAHRSITTLLSRCKITRLTLTSCQALHLQH